MLLVAEQANPDWPSVPLVGWSLARALAEITDAHIVTQVRNREAFEKRGLEEGRDFSAIDSEKVARSTTTWGRRVRGGEGGGWTLQTALNLFSYRYFEKLLWARFGDRIRDGEFDLVHRLTPLSPVVPSLLARRCHDAGVPFVLGPLNGGLPWPRAYSALRRREREWLSPLRALHRFVPGARTTRQLASAILVGSRRMHEQVRLADRPRCVYLPENAVDGGQFPDRDPRVPRLPLRVGFLGRLVPLKAVDVAIEALADPIREGRLELDIVGDGPERDSLLGLSDELGLTKGLRFHGALPREEALPVLANWDVLAFPSIREFGGGAVLEAMAAGVVPVVVDYGGPAELVTESCGIRLPLTPRPELVQSFRRCFADLCANPGSLRSRSQQCRARVQRWFTWRRKAELVREVYDWVLRGTGGPPDFGMPFP